MRNRSGVVPAALTLLALAACGGGGSGPEGGGPALFFPAIPVLLSAGSAPAATAAGDLDRDGLPDVVVAARGAASVAALLGTPSGVLAGPFVHPLPGADPAALTLARLDLDGVLDCAVADAAGEAVHVLRGVGGGTFVPLETVLLPPGADPTAIAAADLDADGVLDLVVCDRQGSEVHVLFGFGDGTFPFLESTSVGTALRPAGLALADLDRDGAIDVATSSDFEGTVSLLRGRGDGTFRDPIFAATDPDARLRALAVGDADRDGVLDLFAAAATSGVAFVLLGAGDGTFAPAAAFEAGPGPVAIEAADVDRDGALDLVTAVNGTGGIAVLLGRGDGTFRAPLLQASGGTGAAGLAVLDVDRDGAPDVAVANERSDAVGVVLGRPRTVAGRFRFLSRVAFPEDREPEGGALADVDRDGRPDLLAVSRDEDAVSVALGLGGGFAAPFDVALDPGSGPVALAVGDLDLDGRLDLAVACATGNEVAVLLGTGTGAFAEIGTLSLGGTAAPSAVAIGDMDRDGLLDVVLALRGPDRVAVGFGLGDGTLEGPFLFDLPAGSDPEALVLLDLDRDGFLDVATAGPGSPDVLVLLSDPTLGLGPAVLSPVGTGASPAGLSAADLDADGFPDLAALDPAAGAVVGMRGNGDGTLIPFPPGAAGGGASALHVLDADRDGLEDAVAARRVSHRVRALFSLGDGTFDAGPDVDSGGEGPSRVFAADLDRDGVLDLVVLHAASAEAVVLRGS